MCWATDLCSIQYSCGKDVSLTPVCIYEIYPLHFYLKPNLGALWLYTAHYCTFYGQCSRSKMIPPEYWRQQIGLLPVLTSTYGTVGPAADSAGSLWNKSLKIKTIQILNWVPITFFFLKSLKWADSHILVCPLFRRLFLSVCFRYK